MFRIDLPPLRLTLLWLNIHPGVYAVVADCLQNSLCGWLARLGRLNKGKR